ncbi:MAG: carboxymuconolactone decarboxylase family protein [Planctomycetes bacterium]|nr:carboxymuconolactone decarboxylase family protein [Planctomycetota bacterium]
MSIDRPPQFFEEVSRQYPEVFAAYRDFSDATASAGPLDERTLRLVKLAIAVGAGLEGAVHSHVRRALAAGLSRAQVEHLILQGMTTLGLPRTMAALSWSRDVGDPGSD